MTSTTTSERTLYNEILEATPHGERLNLCLQCGMCSGICPYGFAMEFPPRSLIAALRAEELTSALDSDLIWLNCGLRMDKTSK